jgi:hypothetical protein
MEDVHHIRANQKSHYPRGDDPAEEPAHEPVCLPGPLAHFLEWDVEAAGGESAYRVKQNTEEWIGNHVPSP